MPYECELFNKFEFFPLTTLIISFLQFHESFIEMVMMLKVPNEEVLKDVVHKIEEEYNLDSRLNRYKSQPELVESASNQGLTDIDDAIRALFVTDFIVTASEVPSGGTDDERYCSVINSFIRGRSRCSSSDSLMRVFYFAYKVATTIRHQDLFMAGRGLSRKAALIRLKDSYIDPYLKVVSDILKKGPCGWELGVLSAALTRMYPDEQIHQFEEVPEYTDSKTLTKHIWRLLENYSHIQMVDTNPNPIIPHMEESQSFLLLDAEKAELVSLWNTTATEVLRSKDDLLSLAQFLNQDIDGKKLVQLRGSILDTMEHLFIVRDPFTNEKPIFTLKTPADELNLSRVLTILHLRGLEQDGWRSMFVSPEKPVVEPAKIKPEKAEPIEEDTLSKEVTPIEEPTPIKEVAPIEEVVTVTEVEEEAPVKVGFFAKIKRKMFGKKPEPKRVKKQPPKQLKMEPPKKEEKELPKKVVTKPPKKGKEKPPKKVKKKDKQDQLISFMDHSSFIAQGITVDAVADMDLFELFDTTREENYYVIGTFETDFEKTNTIFHTKSSSTSPSALITYFNSLDQQLSKLYKSIFKDHQLLIEELFFMADDGQKLIISLNGNQERVVGSIATTYVEKIVDWQSRRRDMEPLSRRSLHMRTSQLLTARRHTPFPEAVGRIYDLNFDVNSADSAILDHPLFSSR